MRFLLPLLLLALWALAMSVVLVQAIGRMGEREASSFKGKLRAFDECQWTIGDKQQLAIYAEDSDLCAALMALPTGASVELRW